MRLCFITIQIETSNSAKLDKIMFSLCHVVLTYLISEFWLGILSFKIYIPQGI